MSKGNVVKKIVFSLMLGVALNANADWELTSEERTELPNQYNQAIQAAELNSFDKVKTIETIAPWNSKLTFSADGQKVLMTAIVPKWCIDSKIYVKSQTYTAPTWPVKILVDNRQRLVKETKIYKQEAYPLFKGKEWTGAWHERYDSSNKFKELRPVIDENYLKTHYNTKYAEKIKHLVNETESKIVASQGQKQDTLVVYEDLKDKWVNQREILQRNFNDRQILDIKTFPKNIREQLSGQRLIWMSPYPEVKNYLQATTNDRERNLKVRQFTGLPVGKDIPSQYSVDMWVDVRDLVRPCADSDTLSNVCAPSPPYAANDPELGSLKDIFAYIPRSNDLTFEFWFKANTDNTYTGANPFPWTRLGYTYNWDVNATSSQGVNEFFLRPGATVEVANVTELKDY